MSGLYTGSSGLAGGTTGLQRGTGLSTPPGLEANDGTASGPSNAILQEGSTTSFIMQEDGTSYILQES